MQYSKQVHDFEMVRQKNSIQRMNHLSVGPSIYIEACQQPGSGWYGESEQSRLQIRNNSTAEA